MAENSVMSDIGNSEGDDQMPFDDAEMALSGINMLLNNGFDEAMALFEKYR